MQQYLADRLIATETAPISRVQSAVNLAALEAVNLETAAGAESLPRSRSMLSLSCTWVPRPLALYVWAPGGHRKLPWLL